VSIKFVRGCGKVPKAKGGAAGRRVRCPACGASLTVPAAVGAVGLIGAAAFDRTMARGAFDRNRGDEVREVVRQDLSGRPRDEGVAIRSVETAGADALSPGLSAVDARVAGLFVAEAVMVASFLGMMAGARGIAGSKAPRPHAACTGRERPSSRGREKIGIAP
jgi:hypothetical protein